uniref:Large ribosomal subunit protein mL51 n=1 Tax=Gallus gallus TaxID=9031 RepID=A0A8V0ZL20_CHICK
MAALVRGLMRRVVALPQAVRSVSGGGQRHEPYRPLPITSPLAGLPRNFRVREPPKPQKVDRWTEKRALFGVYDNVGILGEVSPYRLRALGGRGRRPEAAASGFQIHPKHLIMGPKWLRGWRGNELQRCIRKKQMVGDRMFMDDYHNLKKRIRFLYKRFNRTGKHR